MERSRKTGFGLIILVVLGLVGAYAIGITTQGWAFASPHAQSTLNAATAPEAQSTTQDSQSDDAVQPDSGTSTANDTSATAADTQKQQTAEKEEQLLNNFLTNFASNLGVDEAKLNSAFTQAVNSTADKAVSDGIATQAEADEVKSIAQEMGFKGLIRNGFSGGVREKVGNPADEHANPKLAIMETMHKIGLTNQELESGTQAGKSLADLAQEHNVDAATLKSMILETLKSQLDTAVLNGKLTQAQADAAYEGFASQVDTIINQKGNVSVKGNKDGAGTTVDPTTENAERAALDAALQQLGMQAVDLKQAIGRDGKSLTDLAREHNVEPQTLRDTMLQAGKAIFDAAVADNTLTQEQADNDYRMFTTWVDSLMNGPVQ